MTDLHETTDPKYTAQIDTTGWIFVAIAVVITVVAVILAYQASGVIIANSPYRTSRDHPVRVSAFIPRRSNSGRLIEY